jgi:predicted permease
VSAAATIRQLRHRPWLNLSVILTLALGIGALTATFSHVYAALIRTPPFADSSRLAILQIQRNPIGEAPYRERWSFARFERLRASQTSFELVASYSPASITLSSDGAAELVQSERVSASYFPLLRVSTSRGRLFDETDDDPAGPAAVAVISHHLWASRFASDAAIVGRIVRLNGVPVSIIGVLEDGFAGLSGRSAIWIPRALSAQITYAEYVTTNQNFIAAIGRLRPGVELTTASSELGVLAAAINRALPSDPEHPDERVSAVAIPLNEARINPSVRRSLLLLFGAVALLHLLACANVTNLLLGRAVQRRQEFVVRLALGSSRWRLFSQVFVEGSVLAIIGGAAGILLAWWFTGVTAPPASAPGAGSSHLAPFDAPVYSAVVLAFGILLMFLTAVIVAIGPALSAAGPRPASELQGRGRVTSASGLSLRRPTVRGLIVSVEAALAALLVVGAGLLFDSFQRMRAVDVGVEPDQVLTFWVIPSEARVPPAAAPVFLGRLVSALEQVPGVESVGVDGGAPLNGSASSTLFVEGRPTPGPGEAPPITRHYVSVDHFRTLGIPLRRGRTFAAGDAAGSPRVAVISETAARRFWPGEDPLGRRVWFGGGSDFDSPERSAEIVGIVGDVRYQPFDRPQNLASFYTPFTQFSYPMRMVSLRTQGEPLSVVGDVRRAVASVDPELAVQDIKTMSELMDSSWARRRFDTAVFGGFGVAALLLAATGLFAVLAYSVETRRREFGIRIALGARSRPLLGSVVREGLTFPVVGLSVGLAVSIAASRALEASLFGTSPRDVRVLATVAGILLTASVLACLIPAWRATRANPVEALRAE